MALDEITKKIAEMDEALEDVEDKELKKSFQKHLSSMLRSVFDHCKKRMIKKSYDMSGKGEHQEHKHKNVDDGLSLADPKIRKLNRDKSIF